MDPKRKQIYIIIIVVCFGITAALLGWTYFGPSNNAPTFVHADPLGQAPNQSLAPRVDFSTGGFAAPVVFPQSNTFDTSVLNSAAYKALSSYSPLDATGQIGRDDPFKNY